MFSRSPAHQLRRKICPNIMAAQTLGTPFSGTFIFTIFAMIVVALHFDTVNCRPSIELGESTVLPQSQANTQTSALLELNSSQSLNNQVAKAKCVGFECIFDAYMKLGAFLKQQHTTDSESTNIIRQRRWDGCGYKGMC
ncbi:unnamed protein product [Orchesella dallaii]|uniref:Uncharacterized protein n=1 Tax=Orchesella dallaii TaxID=48710 RepID=A0ABP1QFK4_9HEXA